MDTLFLDEPGAGLRREGERLVVERDEQPLAEVRLSDLARVLVCHHASVTSAALTGCLEQGVELAFVSRGGDLLGHLQPAGDGPAGERRRAQWALSQDAERRLIPARAIVEAKLAALAFRLKRWADRPQPLSGPSAATLSAAEALARVEAAAARLDEADLEALLGLEGAASAAYFAAFPALLRPPPDGQPGFTFPGRRRRPAPDPVNALLGFVYALFENEACFAGLGAGLDLDVGFLHAVTRRRASLALDLLEELRPLLADGVALRLLNRRQLRPPGAPGEAHFGPGDDPGSVWLTEAGRAIVFREVELTLRRRHTLRDGTADTWRGLIRRQARAFARLLADLADAPAPDDAAGDAGPYRPLAEQLR